MIKVKFDSDILNSILDIEKNKNSLDLDLKIIVENYLYYFL